MKPKFLFKNNGSLKEFGTGKDKTIFPLRLLIGLSNGYHSMFALH